METHYTPREEPMELSIVPMDVEYLSHFGSDLEVVNDARVSFAVEHERFVVGKDDRLINYLAKNKHWTPFAHQCCKFRIKAPLFVARQLAKHQVGMVWNEVSRRYVNYTPEFFLPEQFRMKAENKKQGSDEGRIIEYLTVEDEDGNLINYRIHQAYEDFLLECLGMYQTSLDSGVAEEQARLCLPLTTMTEWRWTGSLAAWARVCSLRLDPHAQLETRLVADMISAHMAEIFPVSWKALLKETKCESLSLTPTSSSIELPAQPSK